MNEDLQELKLLVPTYNAEGFPDEVAKDEMPEFGEPLVPVLIREADGVRIVLGTHDYDCETPDIQIERRPNGWAIFLHPLGGSDPSGYVYFLDDGRSFLSPENNFGPTPAIEVLEPHGQVPELDCPKPKVVIEGKPVEVTEGEEPGLNVVINVELNRAALTKLRAAAAKDSPDNFALPDAIDQIIGDDSFFDAASSALAEAVKREIPNRP